MTYSFFDYYPGLAHYHQPQAPELRHLKLTSQSSPAPPHHLNLITTSSQPHLNQQASADSKLHFPSTLAITCHSNASHHQTNKYRRPLPFDFTPPPPPLDIRRSYQTPTPHVDDDLSPLTEPLLGSLFTRKLAKAPKRQDTTMGTPFITFLEPSKLEGYQRGAPRELQPSGIPTPFLDAMEVREEVFVKEQSVPAENEFDQDDPRSCHWAVYASINKTEELEVRDESGNIIQPRKSSTRSTPIGTIRLVPFPHDAHPEQGGKYWDGVLEGEEPQPQITTPKPYITDRPTTFHDGKEPYVKLGRLSVIKEFRGHHIAGLLVKTVLGWLKQHPTYFNPSIKEMGLENMGVTSEKDIPKWNGLVCVHAQEPVKGAWKKWGFQEDEGMGEWWEEGIKHVGMFQRLAVNSDEIRI